MSRIPVYVDFGDGKYSVFEHGEVKNNFTDKFLPKQITNSGYYVVCMVHEGKRKTATVHRLVAKAYLKPVKNKNVVDHRDFNRLNNHFSNLRWVTNQENAMFASQNGRLVNSGKKAAVRMERIGKKYGFDNSQKHLKKAIPVTLFIIDKLISFVSTRQAAIYLNIDHKVLSKRIKDGIYDSPKIITP